MTPEDIAKVAHDANRAYCETIGDFTQPSWDDAPQWQKESARMGVDLHLSGDFPPEASHLAWMTNKFDEGWRWGMEKDSEKKEHPCLVPFDQLPREQQAKDYLFQGIVHALRGFLCLVLCLSFMSCATTGLGGTSSSTKRLEQRDPPMTDPTTGQVVQGAAVIWETEDKWKAGEKVEGQSDMNMGIDPDNSWYINVGQSGRADSTQRALSLENSIATYATLGGQIGAIVAKAVIEGLGINAQTKQLGMQLDAQTQQQIIPLIDERIGQAQSNTQVNAQQIIPLVDQRIGEAMPMVNDRFQQLQTEISETRRDLRLLIEQLGGVQPTPTP
jgi:hypothetical protein